MSESGRAVRRIAAASAAGGARLKEFIARRNEAVAKARQEEPAEKWEKFFSPATPYGFDVRHTEVWRAWDTKWTRFFESLRAEFVDIAEIIDKFQMAEHAYLSI